MEPQPARAGKRASLQRDPGERKPEGKTLARHRASSAEPATEEPGGTLALRPANPGARSCPILPDPARSWPILADPGRSWPILADPGAGPRSRPTLTSL